MERYERPATSSNKPQRRNKQQSKNHHLRKRRPQKPDTSKTAIYVNTKTSTKVFINLYYYNVIIIKHLLQSLLERCDKLIKSGEDQITIHCLGAAIQRGILVALKVVEQHVTFNIHTNTFTTKLIGKYAID